MCGVPETAAELEVRPYMVVNVLPMADTIMRHLLTIEGSLRAPPSRQSLPRSDHQLCAPVRARARLCAPKRSCTPMRARRSESAQAHRCVGLRRRGGRPTQSALSSHVRTSNAEAAM